MEEYGDDIMSGVHTGSAGGAAIGGSIMPGAGTAIGALFGAAGGAFTGWRKADRKKKAQEARERAWNQAQQSLAQNRANQTAMTGEVMNNAYSPVANSYNEMYGGGAQDFSVNPIANQRTASLSGLAKKYAAGQVNLAQMFTTGQITQSEWDQIVKDSIQYMDKPKQQKNKPSSPPVKQNKTSSNTQDYSPNANSGRRDVTHAR